MRNRENGEKGSVRGRIAARYSTCVSGIRGEVAVLRGSGSLTVYGCGKILFYSPERIVVRQGKRRMEICGSRLVCTSFSAGSVTVEGRISGVSFPGEETV